MNNIVKRLYHFKAIKNHKVYKENNLQSNREIQKILKMKINH